MPSFLPSFLSLPFFLPSFFLSSYLSPFLPSFILTFLQPFLPLASLFIFISRYLELFQLLNFSGVRIICLRYTQALTRVKKPIISYSHANITFAFLYSAMPLASISVGTSIPMFFQILNIYHVKNHAHLILILKQVLLLESNKGPLKLRHDHYFEVNCAFWSSPSLLFHVLDYIPEEDKAFFT